MAVWSCASKEDWLCITPQDKIRLSSREYKPYDNRPTKQLLVFSWYLRIDLSPKRLKTSDYLVSKYEKSETVETERGT